ncbi:hypothetical protein [Bradyrhizobium sp. CCGUVB23]|uniref:hypothetical protein n=1 Tax=Bradyrhizobium sp. CCGUVB23 TaxID=2949630 RepID=UPI0020B2D778|nr:hypothetical protein [Bradyrhizobium sp. CCGUVB23]MCP3462633.1 hypothetical protein [Bradyrhizobium sp. CCGUVB23]
MTIRAFCTLAAAIFALIALLQLIRIVMGWSVTLNGVDVPFWASWIAVTVAGALSFVGFRAAMRLKIGNAFGSSISAMLPSMLPSRSPRRQH